MLISEAMQNKLNEQIRMEFSAEHKYLAIAAEFDRRGLKIFSRLFLQQAAEEHDHALRIYDYLSRVGATVELHGVDTPPKGYDSGEAMVRAALDSEEMVTKAIDQIASLAHDESDHRTHGFIQWFVDEQIEEIEKMSDLLTLVQMAGEERLFMLEGRLYHMLNNG